MGSQKIQIHNCHTHIFTLDHLPRNLFPGFPIIIWLVRNDTARKIFVFLAEKLFAGLLKLLLIRYPRVAAFLQICDNTKQSDVFCNSLQHYYPPDTRFVILPMDYSFMGCGDPKYSIDQQLEELAKLRDDFPAQIIPFVHIDPRHDDAVERVKTWVVKRDFRGVKIYPPFGYCAQYKRLNPIFAFCETYKAGIPVMTHCSGATLKKRGLKKKKATSFCSPEHYKSVLTSYPGLRLCLGHFGGERAWSSYLKKPLLKDRLNRNDPNFSGTENWLHQIIDLIRSGSYPNLFVDISYVIFNFQDNINVLKVLLENPCIRRSVLFGTDYYMAEIEKFSEKKLSIYLRAEIGEDNYRLIAETNPRRYLFGEDLSGNDGLEC